MCCTSIFTCMMTMISRFSIIYTFRELFKIFFHKYKTRLHLDVILILVFLTVTFCSFQNQLYFLRVLWKKYKTFSYNLPTISSMSFFYVVKSPNFWHWIFTRNMLSNFCCWRILRINRTYIYFFNWRFNLSINNVWHFIWLHILFNLKFIFSSKRIKTIQAIKISMMFWCYSS